MSTKIQSDPDVTMVKPGALGAEPYPDPRTYTANDDPRAQDLAPEDFASQWKLIWISFRKHKLAMTGLIIVVAMYLIGAFSEFLAPFDPNLTSAPDIYHPPQMIRFIDRSDGEFSINPHVNAMVAERDTFTLETTFSPDPDKKIYLDFFGKGDPYKLWGLIPMERHFLTTENPDEMFFLFGADRLGRDMLSRTIYGTRVSMSIGLVGVSLSLVLGLILGGISGYFGGKVDMFIQRIVELVISLPTIPIWLGLSAALPQDWSPLTRYFAITVILSLVAWTELARVVRGRFLTLRTEDFVTAARLDGGSRGRVIFRHMMPSMVSHIIASVTLAIPVMIIAETSLSFLGLGLTPPIISWGVLLKEAQNIRSIAQAPWLFVPGGAVCLAVLALNFLGDGLRDAADPYVQDND
ncbi:Oligopeptide transport system permease protein OppC [Rhodobacteraceae bacterium THAF1]|uniref:ABC transporter permease n=1 Tax=Palleronia sp. THAF1 TaxID=2587842 RepID=UPI000F3B99B0|nr:ABC transporter permease [Palleronia sp. THAF1]QFU08822.1 Oligopeptide transport system permease protein OppC [Palleronia sp. THAF1]VDC23957.1 Oligopeptide transport system permease protein OppC [Rhodobacteraceae bacterium THAF1]